MDNQRLQRPNNSLGGQRQTQVDQQRDDQLPHLSTFKSFQPAAVYFGKFLHFPFLFFIMITLVQKLADRGYGEDVYKLALLTQTQRNDLVSQLHCIAGHQAKLAAFFTVIDEVSALFSPPFLTSSKPFILTDLPPPSRHRTDQSLHARQPSWPEAKADLCPKTKRQL